MPSTPWLPTIKTVKDGTDVSAATLNPILSQHTQREQHLKELFEELLNKSLLISYNQPILTANVSEVKKNSVVFGDRASNDYGLALARTDFSQSSLNTTAYTPANSSYSFGVVVGINEQAGTADVATLGLLEFQVDINDDSVDNPSIIQSDERVGENDIFEPGPLFLSRTEAGKLTRNPGGVAIFVGYALSRTKIMLSPDVTEFNQFFTAFRYNILDRPAGEPYYDPSANDSEGGWTLIGSESLNKKRVGWVPVTETYLGTEIWNNHVPTDADGNKPAFFYNLPSASDIAEDTGVEAVERSQQADLASTLPPNPVNFTFLTVNGIIQANSDLDKFGPYTINEVGLWWWSNYQDETPWSEDIPTELEVEFSGTSVNFPVTTFLDVGDRLQFSTTDTLPAELSADTDYFVKSIVDPATVQIATTASPSASAITFTSGGVGVHSVKQPFIWKAAKGSEQLRPKMLLQFLKFNPALGESIVTSLKKYNPNSNIIRFYRPNKSVEAIRGTGDLLARILLRYVEATPAESSATAVTGLTYDEVTGITQVSTAPVVSQLFSGDGITVTQLTVAGVAKPGQFVVSNNNNSQSGRISNIEPDGAELIYTGLHSYLEMPYPTVLPSSIIGKILLPAGVPASDLKLVILTLGNTALSANATNVEVAFDFNYSITKPGLPLAAPTTPVPVTWSVPVPALGYPAKTVFKTGAGLTASAFSLPNASLIIPATAFVGGDCAINFKLTRKVPASNAYAYPIGIVDLYWRIG